jgi:hypothetical protein
LVRDLMLVGWGMVGQMLQAKRYRI